MIPAEHQPTATDLDRTLRLYRELRNLDNDPKDAIAAILLARADDVAHFALHACRAPARRVRGYAAAERYRDLITVRRGGYSRSTDLSRSQLFWSTGRLAPKSPVAGGASPAGHRASR